MSAVLPATPKPSRQLNARSRAAMAEGAKKGQAAIREAMEIRRSLGAVQSLELQAKGLALSSSITIIRRWIKGATGRIRSWPASVQLEAGKMILGVAGIALESKAAGSGPLSEMTLQDLHDSLAASLDSTRQLMAIESTASQVIDNADPECPNQCTEEQSAAPGELAEAEQAPSVESPVDTPT